MRESLRRSCSTGEVCDHVYLLNHLVLASMISTEIAIGLLPRLSPCDIVYLNFDNLYQLYVINFKPVKIVCKAVTTLFIFTDCI